jgi:L,D-transpeptidase ErfK/SrfK
MSDTLKTILVLKKGAALLAVSLFLTGCAALEDFLAPLGSTPEEAAVVTPVEERPRLDPISRNYFELDTPDQSVVGEPQIVFASEENTFSDLAREYGLGYDELVAASNT